MLTVDQSKILSFTEQNKEYLHPVEINWIRNFRIKFEDVTLSPCSMSLAVLAGIYQKVLDLKPRR